MKKLSFKNVFSKAFVASLVAVAVSGMNVDALSINETAGSEIKNGSFVIGITRFSDVSVSGQMIVDATIDDQAYAAGNPNYAGSRSIYYYDEDWYVLDRSNKAQLVTDNATINKLNSQDIFYVNNEEKYFDFSYERDIPKNHELIFTTDKGDDKVSYDAKNKIMRIYATANTVTVTLHKTSDTTNTNDEIMDTFTKTLEDNKEDFDYKTNSKSAGTISVDGDLTELKDATINGNTINIGGTIKWVSKATGASISNEKTKAGYRVGVKISLPNGTSTANLSEIEVYANGVEDADHTITWAGNSLIYTPIVENGKSSTLVVKWLNGTTQTFTINVNGTLEEKPAGKLSAENLYVKDEQGKDTEEVRLSGTAAADNSKITFSGKNVELNESVVVYIEPDARYKNITPTINATSLVRDHDYNPDDKFSTKTEYKNGTVNVNDVVTTLDDGRRVIKVTVPFSENTDEVKGRTVTLNVKWDTSYTQPIDVVLDESTPFTFTNPKEVGFDATDAVKYSIGDDDLVAKAVKPTTKEPDVVNIENVNIAWDKTNGGNRIEATVDATRFDGTQISGQTVTLTGGKSVTERDFLTVELDGKEVKYETTDKDGNKVQKTLTFNTTLKATDKILADGIVDVTTTSGKLVWNFALSSDYNMKDGETHTITLKYAGKEVKTLTINVNAVANKVTGGVLNIKNSNKTHYILETSGSDLNLSSQGQYDKDNQLIYETVDYDYLLAYNSVPMELKNVDYTEPSKVTAKVGNGEEISLDPKYSTSTKSTTLNVPVSATQDTVITVTWDAKNVQTFNLSTDADKLDFAKRENGSVAAKTNPAADPTDDTRADKTKLIYSGKVVRDNKGYNITTTEEVKDPDTDTVTTPAVNGITITVPDDAKADVDTTDNADGVGYISINGGIYQNTNDSATDGSYFKKKLSSSDGFTYSNGTITMPLYVTENSKRVVVTVEWNKNYVVDYVIDASGADFKNAEAVTLKTGAGAVAVTSDANNKLTYSELRPLKLANGFYSLNIQLAGNNAKKVEIDDAHRAADYYKNVNGKKELVPTARAIDKTSGSSSPVPINKDTDIAVYFTEERKTATIKVTLTNDEVQEFTVDASNAIYPSIKLNSNVQYVDGKGYVLTVKKGEKFDVIGVYDKVEDITVSPSNEQQAYPVTGVSEDVVKEVANSTQLEAVNAGTATISVSGKTTIDDVNYVAQSYSIEVTVLEDEDTPVTVTANTREYTNAGKKYVEITAAPNGGRNNKYDVKFSVEKFVENSGNGNYEMASDLASYTKTISEPNPDGKYVAKFEIKDGVHYRYKVLASNDVDILTDNSDVEQNVYALPAEYVYNKCVVDDAPVKYNVKFVGNDGLTVLSEKTVGAGESVLPHVYTRTDDTYYYVLKGWYNAEDVVIKDSTTDDNAKELWINGSKVTDGYVDANNDIILTNETLFDGDNASDRFDPDTGEYTVDNSSVTSSITKDITLRAVWYRIPIQK